MPPFHITTGTELIHFATGITQLRLKLFKEALYSFTRAIQVKPTDQGYNGLGTAYFSMRKRKEARIAFAEALNLNPESALAHYNLGVTCLTTGERDCALSHYNRLQILSSPLAKTLFNHIYAGKVIDVRALQP